MNYRPETLAMIRAKMPLIQEEMFAEDKPLSFFALLLRDANFNKWDFVVAAPWIDEDKRVSLKYLAKKLNTHLNPDEIMAISRIATINLSDPRWKEYTDRFFSDSNGPDVVFLKEEFLFDVEMSAAVLSRASNQAQYAKK